MAEIAVQRLSGQSGPGEFEVIVSEGNSGSRHRVAVEAADLAELAGGREADDLLRRSFEFLLEREPKESILSRFRLVDISRYYPEYRSIIRQP